MRDLSSIDIRFLVRELREAMVDSRIDKVYAPQTNDLVLQMRRVGSKKIIRFIVPQFCYVASTKPEMPEQPSIWCALLRKLLEGAKVLDVSQPASERIILIKLGRGDTSFNLVLEFYAKGNIVVTDTDGSTRAMLHEIASKDRTVTRGAIYEMPKGIDTFSLTIDEFRAAFAAETKNASTVLATRIGVGALYAHELCVRAQVDAKSVASQASITALFDQLRMLLASPAQPNIIDDHDAMPILFLSLSGRPVVRVDSFSVALERVSQRTAVVPITGAAKALEMQRQRLMHSIKAQDQAVKKLELAAVSSHRVGEILYEHHQEFKSLLEQLAIARKQGAVDAFMKRHKRVVGYNPTTGDVTVELPDS